MVHITESYITSADVKKLCNDIKKYLKSGKLEKDSDLQKSIADKVILAEKETLRYELIFHYGFEHGIPSVLDLVDREYLIDSFLANESDPDFYISSSEDISNLFNLFSVDDEAKDLLDYLDSIIDILSDNERRFADPVAYERQAREDAIYDE